jgi:colanic acid/amylovoran biosynthesis glycosyltransferase
VIHPVLIAYLVNQYPANSHSFIRREILALEQLGFEVMRISLRGWDRELADEEDRRERVRTWYVLRTSVWTLTAALVRTAIERPLGFMAALRAAWRMSRTSERPVHVHVAYLTEACCIDSRLREAGIHHLHAHFGTNSAEVAMLVHILGGPQWSFTVHGPEEFDKALLIGLAAKVRRCSFVVAVSSFGRSQLFRLVEQKYWPKVHLVHCGLDPAFCGVPTNAPSAACRLVCVGRLCEQKGQLLLVEAVRLLAEERKALELVLVGDGEMRNEIELLVKQHDLTDRIQITGWVSGDVVKEQILAARALVLPSFAEGLPVVLMEAMALRRPVISTYVGGIPELVRDGEHGWLVPAGDVEALVDAMRSCLEAPPELIMRMGKAARERVMGRHDVNTEAKKLQQLFSNPKVNQ